MLMGHRPALRRQVCAGFAMQFCRRRRKEALIKTPALKMSLVTSSAISNWRCWCFEFEPRTSKYAKWKVGGLVEPVPPTIQDFVCLVYFVVNQSVPAAALVLVYRIACSIRG